MREAKGKSIIALPSDFIVIDTETTGLDYEFDHVIEVSAIKYVNFQAVDTFTSLIQPPPFYSFDENKQLIEEYVSEFITQLTGISNEMLEDAPTTETVIPQFLSFVGDSVLIGHNVNFDINFLYDAAKKYCGSDFSNDFIDTLRIARKVFPELEHHRLSDVASACHVDQGAAHRAEADCVVTAKCYEFMRNMALSTRSEAEFVGLFKKKHKHDIYQRYKKELAAVAPTVDDFDETNPVFGKTVVFTGALSSMGRKDAFQLVCNLGGTPGDRITKKTNFLVIGNSEFVSSVKNGKTNKMKTAEAYQSQGLEIMVLSENSFFDMISDYI